jgi:hypothetical protein
MRRSTPKMRIASRMIGRLALRTILNHTDGLKGGWDYLFSQFKRAVANFPLADRRKLLPTTRPASVASRSSLPHSDSDMLSA